MESKHMLGALSYNIWTNNN